MMSAKEFDKLRLKSGIGLRQICREANVLPPTYYYALKRSGWWKAETYFKLESALSRLTQSA